METTGDSEESDMKKLFKDMTNEEQIAFTNELSRMYTRGAACLDAAAKNANEKPHGWPLITVYGSGNVTETPICDALHILYKSGQSDIMHNVNFLTILSNSEAMLEMSIHQAMHDAFCLGIAAATDMEMDFRGFEDFLDRKDNDNDSQ